MTERPQEQYLPMIEEALKTYLPRENCLQKELCSAMEYSLLAGGKRIRPILTLEFCRVCGGELEAALPFACAVEMVHTYSLIHDDLPCMDNDDLRRGRASNHKVYGEDMALLAGDALLTLAFETMLSPASIQKAGALRAASAAGILARAAGADGMVGGQVIDLKSEDQAISIDLLQAMDHAKTGALIKAAALMGCVVAGAGEAELAAADTFTENIGLAFQIVDDILDVTGQTAKLGKKVGSDQNNKKSTYVSLLGLEAARDTVKKLTNTAVGALVSFKTDTAYLTDLAYSLAKREK